MTLNHKYFKSHLAYIRQTLGMTQQELADLSGLEVTAISHFECGRRQPSLENFCVLCNALQVKPEKLLCGLLEAVKGLK